MVHHQAQLNDTVICLRLSVCDSCRNDPEWMLYRRDKQDHLVRYRLYGRPALPISLEVAYDIRTLVLGYLSALVSAYKQRET